MEDYLSLLDQLIATPSFSREEDGTAMLLHHFLESKHIKQVHRERNNVWAYCATFDSSKPTLLLNSHHDTVRPSSSYTRNPFTPSHEHGRIYGLGSNDAGGSLVSLIATFCRLYEESLPVNLLLALSAEEEITGENGIRHLLPLLPKIDMGIVGEPTGMDVAVGERGLVVLDGIATGVRGHAAHNEGTNALYIALDDIIRLKNYRFEKESPLLGPVKITTTQIKAGSQHNVIPDECHFVVDVRTTDAYSNEETVEILQSILNSTITPRSTRIRASAISQTHPLVKTAKEMGIHCFVSPTTSDMSQMAFPTIKMGPGDSARSHRADEWIEESEIAHAIDTYIKFIRNIQL